MKSKKHPVYLLGIAVLIISQLACETLMPSPATQTPIPTLTSTTTATASNAPTPTPDPSEALPFTDDEIQSGIQATLDLYADALTKNKPELLTQVVDQENKPFRRIVRSRFDEYQSSYVGGQVNFRFQVLEITRREYGFVLARFDYNGLEAEWSFRNMDGTWVISEPLVEQIGEAVTTETEHFIFKTYPWSDDVNAKIIDLMETARNNVKDVLGKVPDEKAHVEIVPIYGLYPYDPMNAIASYSKGASPAQDKIEIYPPNSFAFSYYDPNQGWEEELENTLTHEYTHMAHARSFNQAGRLSDWMSEGLAEYVAGATDENTYSACVADANGTFIPIIDETQTVYKQDLMHMYALNENFGLSYDFATSLVAFTVEKYGGLDGFWKLANGLDKASDFKKAVKETLGIPYDEYNNKWQAWLKKKC